MRVLVVNSRYFVSGGPERYLFNLKSLLESKGHEVVPFSVKSQRNVNSRYEKFFSEPLGGQDVPYFSQYRKTPRVALGVVARLFYSWHVRRRLEALIDKEKPDVALILNHYNKLSPSVIDACKSRGVRVIHRLSDYYLVCPQAHLLTNNQACDECLTFGLRRCIRKKCIRGSFGASILKVIALFFQKRVLRVYDKVDKFVCTNEFMRSKMLDGGFDTKKLHTIPTFIPRFENSNFGDKNYLLYIGRFSEEKGVGGLVRSFLNSGLQERGVSLHLVGGAVEELNFSESVLSQLKRSESRVYFTPFASLEVVEKFIRNAMAVIVPSVWYENLPNVILEAYRFNKPVIASNIGSIPEHVLDGKTGLLFAPGNEADMAEKMKTIAIDDYLRKKLKTNIEKFRQEYGSELHLNRLLSLFENVLV